MTHLGTIIVNKNVLRLNPAGRKTTTTRRREHWASSPSSSLRAVSASFSDFSSQQEGDIQVVPCETLTLAEAEAEARGRRATHSITVETANLRGGELRDCNAGIWLALFDQEGKCAVNHVVGLEGKGGKVVDFDRGTEETFAICASGLGDKIERVWIGPGASTWLPERVTVQSLVSENSTSSTFTNNAMLGERQDVAAAELKLFDPEEYQRSILRDNTNYAELRNALLLSDALLVSVGTALLYFSQGEAEAINFGAGGAIGFLYLSLLSSSVASIGKEKDSLLEKVFTFPATRFLLVLSLTYLVIQNNHQEALVSSVSGENAQDTNQVEVLRSIVETVAGLLMYKVSVLLVSTVNAASSGNDSNKTQVR